MDNKQPRGVGRADHKQPGKDTSLHWAAKLPSLHSLDTSTVTCGCAQHLHECWWHQWSWLPVQAADNMLAVCRLQLPLRRILGTLGAAVGCCSSQAVQPGFIQARMGLLHQVAGHMQCSAVRDPSKQQCRQCTSRGGCSSTRQSRASASGSIAPESGGCLEAAQEQGGKAIQPTAPEDGLPGVHFRTASVTSGGEGTLRCFEPSQGCSDSPDTPAQHDIVWLVGCFMSGMHTCKGFLKPTTERQPSKLKDSSVAAHGKETSAQARPAAGQFCIAPVRSCRAPTWGVAATCSLTSVSSHAILASCLSRGADSEHVGQLLRGDGPVSNEPAQVVQTGGQLLAVVRGGTALRSLQRQSHTAFQVARPFSAVHASSRPHLQLQQPGHFYSAAFSNDRPDKGLLAADSCAPATSTAILHHHCTRPHPVTQPSLPLQVSMP